MSTPVPSIERELATDTEVDQYLLPKGTMVNISIFSMHHVAGLYPDPYTFDASRFSEENCEKRHPHAFVPFSAGPRNCIGQVLAMNELKYTLANVLVHFELDVDKTLPESRYEDAVVTRAKPPIKLLVRNLHE